MWIELYYVHTSISISKWLTSRNSCSLWIRIIRGPRVGSVYRKPYTIITYLKSSTRFIWLHVIYPQISICAIRIFCYTIIQYYVVHNRLLYYCLHQLSMGKHDTAASWRWLHTFGFKALWGQFWNVFSKPVQLRS